MYHLNQDSLLKIYVSHIWVVYKKKAGMFGNIPIKVLKEPSNVCNVLLRDIWNFQILGEQNFLQNIKLADITPVYKKKDPVKLLTCQSTPYCFYCFSLLLLFRN